MKINKLFIVISIFTIIFIFVTNYCAYAKDSVDSTTSDLISSMNPHTPGTTPETSSLTKILAQFFSVIQFAGTGISAIMIMWLGISYMVSSVEQKAEIKKRSVPIIIGSILIVSTVNILKFLSVLVGVSVKDNP